jgi:hypothetical protein
MNSRAVTSATSLLSVYDGRRCIVFVLARGKAGFEAFDRDEQSRGLFAMQGLAIAALGTDHTATADI